LRDIDARLPVILLDHQPNNLEEAEQADVDLQLSGHTHHGQLFPLHYITGKMYEQDWGYLRKGKTQYYISCGTGTWGPPVRTSGFSEVVIIDLAFRAIK
jgi:predicted MPP superfamily phosphohydrolase